MTFAELIEESGGSGGTDEEKLKHPQRVERRERDENRIRIKSQQI